MSSLFLSFSLREPCIARTYWRMQIPRITEGGDKEDVQPRLSPFSGTMRRPIPPSLPASLLVSSRMKQNQ